jgi:V-type H+-transporting ATPase subunit E
MKEREHLMKGLMDEARQRIAKVTNDEKTYSQLISKLILQALVKLDETNVIVYCRACDVKLAKKAADTAQKDFIALMKKECNEDVKLTLKVNDDSARMLAPPPSGGPGAFCSGGVRLTACNGKLVCDNTLDARLKLIYEEQMPRVRKMLFPNSVVVITHAPPKRKEGTGAKMEADED